VIPIVADVGVLVAVGKFVAILVGVRVAVKTAVGVLVAARVAVAEARGFGVAVFVGVAVGLVPPLTGVFISVLISLAESARL
jgi:hypothetical protein